MLADYTPAVIHALSAAHRLAQQLGESTVQPLHLLQGLLGEEEGRPWLLLAEAGLDPMLVRNLVPSTSVSWSPGEAEPALPLSQAVEAVLAQARGLARDFADGNVASELVLLALLRGEESLRRRLEGLGLVFARLEDRLEAEKGPPLRLEEPLDLEEPSEQVDTARILDANANRAREALRVIEDYCRFVLEDAFLGGEVKRLRHDLTQALSDLPDGLLLAARETLRDVGTTISTPQEQRRHSLTAVVQASCKRLQEAMRSLEEFGKLRGPTLGLTLEQMRYRAYTLERALLLGTDARARLAEVRLYMLVTGSLCWGSLDWTLREAAAGGVQMVQLREKGMADGALLERARQVRRWAHEAGVLFLMNDRPDLARLVEADGVHLGQEDMSVKDARRILGPDGLIGVSTHNLRQVRQAVLDGASYLGVGPTFPSQTKDFGEFPGLDLVRQATAETSLPAFAIGGITLANLPEVIAAGGRRVAVSQALCRTDQPQAVAKAMRQILDGC